MLLRGANHLSIPELGASPLHNFLRHIRLVAVRAQNAPRAVCLRQSPACSDPVEVNPTSRLRLYERLQAVLSCGSKPITAVLFNHSVVHDSNVWVVGYGYGFTSTGPQAIAILPVSE